MHTFLSRNTIGRLVAQLDDKFRPGLCGQYHGTNRACINKEPFIRNRLYEYSTRKEISVLRAISSSDKYGFDFGNALHTSGILNMVISCASQMEES